VLRSLAVVLLVLALVLAVPTAVAQEAGTKVVVLRTEKFTTLSYYMYHAGTKALTPVNVNYVEVYDYELRDKVRDDAYLPCVVLEVDPPTKDASTNEVVVHAWVLAKAVGEALTVAVADVSGSTVTTIRSYTVSPVNGDVAIVRTGYDVVVYSSNLKLSVPLSGIANPKVMVMTSSLVVDSLVYVQLRSLADPPPGYTLIRSGMGEQVFTISASGRMYVWFDESHEGGDLDLFVFDQSHPRYNAVSLSSSWADLVFAVSQDATRATYIFADSGPGAGYITASGTVKLIVKLYSGNADAVQWRVASRLEAGTQPPGTPTQPPPTPTPTPGTATGLLGTIGAALSNQSTVLVVLGILLLLVLVLALRK